MKFLIKALFKVIKLLINLVLLPLNLLVQNVFPDTANLISNVNSFFTKITEGVLWVKSWLPFTDTFYIILVSVLVFKFTVPLIVHTIKLVVKWYNALKP